MASLIEILFCAAVLHLIAYNRCGHGQVSDNAYAAVTSCINFVIGVATINIAMIFDWLIIGALGCVFIADVQQYLER